MQEQSNRTLIFWGAGATASLGISVTADHSWYVSALAGVGYPTQSKLLADRVRSALFKNGRSRAPAWEDALSQLLLVLGDEPENQTSINEFSDAAIEAVRKNLPDGATESEIRGRIILLRTDYDWPALKAVIQTCPVIDGGKIDLNDLFNLLDMHIPAQAGFHVVIDGRDYFLDARRLIGARKALRMLLTTLFYIDYHDGVVGQNGGIVSKYIDFFIELGKRQQRSGIRSAHEFELFSPDFYLSEVGFVSLNYDPIGFWLQFLANRELNQTAAVPHVLSRSGKAVSLQLFHDFAHMIPTRRIASRTSEKGKSPWFPMNESSAQRMNEDCDSAIRVTKFLLPHGCLCWRECPSCGKLSSYMGSQWDERSLDLIPPPPLRSFTRAAGHSQGRISSATEKENKAHAQGKVDAIACLHCGTLTYAHHTQTVMQSSFKSTPPSFIEEIQRDMRVAVSKANHIVLLGYSLPRDDVTYRAFFAARRRLAVEDVNEKVRCTVVGYDPNYPGWYGPDQLAPLPKNLQGTAVESAQQIFGPENVRYFGGGMPEVVAPGAGTVSAEAVEKLLCWSE